MELEVSTPSHVGIVHLANNADIVARTFLPCITDLQRRMVCVQNVMQGCCDVHMRVKKHVLVEIIRMYETME